MPAAARARRAAQAGGAEAEGGGAEGADESFDLDAELDKIIGLDAVKDMLRSIRNSVQVAKRRQSFPISALYLPYISPYLMCTGGQAPPELRGERPAHEPEAEAEAQP